MKTASENVIRRVAKVMADARAGDVLAVMIVTVGADGNPDVGFAGESELLPSVNIGLDMAKSTVISMVLQAVMPQPVSSIVRPAGALDG